MACYRNDFLPLRFGGLIFRKAFLLGGRGEGLLSECYGITMSFTRTMGANWEHKQTSLYKFSSTFKSYLISVSTTYLDHSCSKQHPLGRHMPIYYMDCSVPVMRNRALCLDPVYYQQLLRRPHSNFQRVILTPKTELKF